MASKFTVSMVADNIGPHHGANKLVFSEDVDSNKAVFYAINGTGKSFISRAFRLCSPSKASGVADEILSLGEQEGIFSFDVHVNGMDKKLNILIKRGQTPVISDTSGFFYHVFNSDYVEENIRAKNYSPDGEIEGYILGKIQIDLTEEKQNAVVLKEEMDAVNKEINAIIDKTRSFLRDNGVTSNTIEYQAITRENAEHGFEYDASDSVEQCLQRLKTLEAAPENLEDVTFSVQQLDLSFLELLESILLTSYPKSEWDESFVKDYKERQSFIEMGLDYGCADKKCPFCKREYDVETLDLISLYNQYRNDQEARVVSQLRNLLQLVNQMEVKLDDVMQRIVFAESQLALIQKYFPSLVSSELTSFKRIDDYKVLFRSLSDMSLKKMDNLCLSIENAEKVISDCKQAWLEILNIQNSNRAVVEIVNKTKNDARSERLLLRKKLCKVKSIALQHELNDKFISYNEKKARLEELQDTIARKEQQTRISRREKVYETLESSLNRFFNGKYQIDKDTFQIKFLGNTVGENVSNILSDGEKNIVAFCWYLAETHLIINNEDDYNKLFFVVDDPISSMDFHFVYAVAQAIREIKGTFGFSSHERIWIFTHNNEFFSILMRNNILAEAFLMTPGSIQRFNHKLLMPYENHLADLTDVVDGKKKPNHTTGNSIRHIIETIAKFENPEISLDKYVRENEKLSKDLCIFSLCQDLSHGNIRMEPPYSEDVLKGAAKTVIDFIEGKYPGQLKSIRQ